jgi:formylmethanofuran dehydrogenase subunit E
MTVRGFGIRPLVGVEIHWLEHVELPAKAPPSYETCDRCGERLPARHIFFDGEHFLCRACRILVGDDLRSL